MSILEGLTVRLATIATRVTEVDNKITAEIGQRADADEAIVARVATLEAMAESLAAGMIKKQEAIEAQRDRIDALVGQLAELGVEANL